VKNEINEFLASGARNVEILEINDTARNILILSSNNIALIKFLVNGVCNVER
jgi:hypothetical protein